MRLIPVSVLLIATLCAVGQKATPPAGQKAAPASGSSAAAKSAQPASGPLPSNEQIDAAMKRVFGYDPAVTWQILDITRSPIPGVADVLLSINRQAPIHMYLSETSQEAIVGELLPFGANPFAAARSRLSAADGPAQGAQQPVISIVEFSDLECPHCKAAQPIVEKLVTDFPQVRYTFQQFPLPASLHPWAMKAALYADCAAHANKTAFWKYIDSIFENQAGIATATADDKLKELATTAGLDAQKLAACAVDPATQARVNKSLDLGKSLDVNETPTVFINGRRVKGIANIPYDQLKALVQFEIDHAGR